MRWDGSRRTLSPRSSSCSPTDLLRRIRRRHYSTSPSLSHYLCVVLTLSSSCDSNVATRLQRGGIDETVARARGRSGDLRVDTAAASPRPDLAQRGVVVRVHQLADRLRLVLRGGGVHSRRARGSRARRSHGGPADDAAG